MIKNILIIVLFSNNAFCAFYFSDIITTNTNQSYTNITETMENIESTYTINTNEDYSILKMEGSGIISQNGVKLSPVTVIPEYKTPPFRYTEVTFFLTVAFAYTYASLAVYGFTTIENNLIVSVPNMRSRYKTLWTSSTLFEVVAAVFCASAVAYDSYQRVYGKKKEDKLSFNFVPFYDAKNKDAGFVFAFNYPYRF